MLPPNALDGIPPAGLGQVWKKVALFHLQVLVERKKEVPDGVAKPDPRRRLRRARDARGKLTIQVIKHGAKAGMACLDPSLDLNERRPS
jgi:hypothetical protein